MKITRFCFCMMLLTLSAFIWAERFIPNDMNFAQLKATNGKQVVLSNNAWNVKRIVTLGMTKNNQVFQLNNNTRIRDDGNRFITPNRLSRYLGRSVAVRFDKMNRIQEIWVLTNNEQLMWQQHNQLKR